MNRLHLRVSLLAGLALIATIEAPPAAADSVRVPIRSANARTRQIDPAPAPATVSPTPIAPVPGLPPSVGAPLPPQPVPDQPVPDLPAFNSPVPPAAGGRLMIRGPLGADFEATDVPKKQYLGDPQTHGLQPVPEGPMPRPVVPFVQGQPGAEVSPRVLSGPTVGTDSYGIAPPAGTLGQTYQRRSRLIDDEKHPRVGIVEVHLSENYEVSAKGMKVKWTGKVWRLESEPLLPGIPHIYEVKSEWGPENAKQQQVRTVRLIMGRIVDLEF